MAASSRARIAAKSVVTSATAAIGGRGCRAPFLVLRRRDGRRFSEFSPEPAQLVRGPTSRRNRTASASSTWPARAQAVARLLDHFLHRGLAEQGFISFWLRTAVPAAMPTSAPVRPPVCTNTASITVTAPALTPSETPRARRCLPAPFDATSAAIVRTHSSSAVRVRPSVSGLADHSDEWRPAGLRRSVRRPVGRRPARRVGGVREAPAR